MGRPSGIAVIVSDDESWTKSKTMAEIFFSKEHRTSSACKEEDGRADGLAEGFDTDRPRLRTPFSRSLEDKTRLQMLASHYG